MSLQLPLEIKELNGSFDHDPQRRPKTATPKSEFPIGNPPDYLCAPERRIWREIVGYSVPGVLTGLDRPVLEMLVRIYAKFRAREQLTGPEYSKFLDCCRELGMTPVARQRIAIDPPKVETNPFAEFMAGAAKPTTSTMRM